MKLKTNSSSKKRFSITSKGHLLRSKAGNKHKFLNKTSKQKSRLKSTMLLKKSNAKNIKVLLPYL